MKKMRRLIPAIAMLLVSAVMLSTASFAWFTMNSEVEATGMTVQAKSTGTMVIDTKPLNALSTGWEAQFATLGNKKLAPVSYGSYNAASLVDGNIQVDQTASKGWFDAFDNKRVDSMTGETLYFKEATLNTNNYFDYVVYVGMASESEVKNIKASLETDLQVHIAGAYAIAFYVDSDASNGVNAINEGTEPDLILHCTDKTGLGVTNNGLLFEAPVAIPSTVGVEASTDGSGVGIAITMRVYIDGNLKDGGKYTPQVPSYEVASGAFDPAQTYYTKSGDVYTRADLNPDDFLKDTTATGNVYNDLPANTYYVFKELVDGPKRDTYFVSNAYAPQAPSQLNVSFELVDESRTAG